MGKIYVIGSQKGGVGKTTSTLNLAYALRKQGKKVLAVDFDSQANLTACYGIENTGELENTIGHLMMAAIEDEKLPAMKKCIRTEDGVDFIPSSIYLSVADAKLRRRRFYSFFHLPVCGGRKAAAGNGSGKDPVGDPGSAQGEI